jgi:F-type H+-transporting ATPase subunit b
MLNESVIVAIAFFVFIGLTFKYIKQGLLTMLNSHVIKALKNIRDAEKIKQEAEEMYAEVEAKYNEIIKTSEQIINRANQDVESMFKDMEKRIAEFTEKKTQLSISRINQQEQTLIEEIKSETIKLAIDLVHESITKELSKEAQLALLDDALVNTKKIIN